MTDKKATSPWLRLGIDFGPLIIFFISFKFGGIYTATIAFMVASVIAMVVSRMTTGRIAPMLKVTFVIVMVMGGLTLYLQDDTFVKMKLTVINALIAIVLAAGLFTGKLYIKMVMELAFEMDDDGWRKFTRNYIIFLVLMAVINELIWRTQSTDFWVNFKTFGYMGATFVFILAQMPMLMKYMPDEDEDSGKA